MKGSIGISGPLNVGGAIECLMTTLLLMIQSDQRAKWSKIPPPTLDVENGTTLTDLKPDEEKALFQNVNNFKIYYYYYFLFIYFFFLFI